MRLLTRWTLVVPLLALLTLGLTWGRKGLPAAVVVLVALVLSGAVLSAVQHARWPSSPRSPTSR